MREGRVEGVPPAGPLQSPEHGHPNPRAHVDPPLGLSQPTCTQTMPQEGSGGGASQDPEVTGPVQGGASEEEAALPTAALEALHVDREEREDEESDYDDDDDEESGASRAGAETQLGFVEPLEPDTRGLVLFENGDWFDWDGGKVGGKPVRGFDVKTTVPLGRCGCGT